MRNITFENELSDNENNKVFIARYLDYRREERTTAVHAKSFEDFYDQLIRAEGNIILLGYTSMTESEYKEEVA